MTHTRFIEPLDVLFLRGNRVFGAAGSYGESLLPPWPSVAAGALRSLLHAGDGKVLDQPEDFRLTAFHLARHVDGRDETVHALPADLIVQGTRNAPEIMRFTPTPLHDAIMASTPLPHVPALATADRGKPLGGFLLSRDGWQEYLAGRTPTAAHLLKTDTLWQVEDRIGVGLDPHSRRAEDGKLFSMQAIAFHPGAGFVVRSSGRVAPPEQGLLRLGGDGRGAHLRPATDELAGADHAAIAQAGRARLVLTTPGLFPDGWRLPGMQADGRWELAGVRARVVAVAITRSEVVSGWDMQKKLPKPAQRVAPTGSVYWLEDLQAGADALDKLADHGLWPETDHDTARRAEGFNRFAFAAI